MPKPHIIIFNPDQWRGDVVGHLGNSAASTPHLDQAVRDGGFVSFRNAFCQNPVCTPSRCSFMTGWYPHVRGHRTMNHMLHIEEGEPVLLNTLKNNGYQVWWGGKNDLVPVEHGYEAFCDIRNVPQHALPQYGKDDSWRGAPGDDTFYSFYAGKIDKGEATHYHDWDWANVESACRFIREYQDERPLCLYLALSYPHPPYGVEEPWYGTTPRNQLPPRIPTPDWNTAGKPAILQELQRRQGLEAWTEDQWNELRGTYYDACARVDYQFGLVLAALKEAGMYDQSAIFFFSDHGDFTGDYGLVEKTQNTFEDCLARVPLLIKPPEDVPCCPRISEALVELIDFAATVYDFAEIDPGYDHFGRSLKRLIGGATDFHRDTVFCEGGRRPGETQAMELSGLGVMPEKSLYWPRMSLQCSDEAPWHSRAVMCRTLDAKYVCRLGEQDEFYDLTQDPTGSHNGIDDPFCQERVAAMKERLLRWWLETGDVIPRRIDKCG